MKRRDFLKLAASVLAGLGLKPGKKAGTSDAPEITVTSGYVDTGELEVHKWQTTFDGGLPLKDYWPMGDVICTSASGSYIVATSGYDFIESYDDGKTWDKV